MYQYLTLNYLLYIIYVTCLFQIKYNLIIRVNGNDIVKFLNRSVKG